MPLPPGCPSLVLETAVNILKRDTRHFAKRQLTWFRRERDVRFLYLPEFDNDRERVLEHILQELAAEAGDRRGCRERARLPALV